MNFSDVKIYALNLFALTISMSKIELFLKITVLITTIGYTLHKWWLMNKKK